MHVVMAIEALRKLDLEPGVPPGGNVALRAIDIRVLSDKRIQRGRVLFQAKC